MRRSSIVLLPAALREELDSKLLKNGFGQYEELAAWLKREGHPIGKSSVHRYGAKLERKLYVWRVPVAGNASEKLAAQLSENNTRRKQAKLRADVGTLVIVIDAPTRETWTFATHHNVARTRDLIELALAKNIKDES